jgi:nitroreductase
MTPHEETSAGNAPSPDTSRFVPSPDTSRFVPSPDTSRFVPSPDTVDSVVAGVVKRRRTNLLMDRERGVDDALVEELLDLITWAPNHKRTWPWQVAVFTGASRASLGEACAADLLAEGITDDAKVTKTRGKYTRSPVVVAVGQIGFSGNDDAHRVAEDRDAVAAGIQNLLLGATAAGLASYWGSAAYPTGPALLDCCGFGPTSRVNALIYLGWPSSQPEPPLRPVLPVTWHR